MLSKSRKHVNNLIFDDICEINNDGIGNSPVSLKNLDEFRKLFPCDGSAVEPSGKDKQRLFRGFYRRKQVSFEFTKETSRFYRNPEAHLSPFEKFISEDFDVSLTRHMNLLIFLSHEWEATKLRCF